MSRYPVNIGGEMARTIMNQFLSGEITTADARHELKWLHNFYGELMAERRGNRTIGHVNYYQLEAERAFCREVFRFVA